MLQRSLIALLVFGLISKAQPVRAQASDAGEDQNLDQIEAEIKKNEPKITPAPVVPITKDNSSGEAKEVPPPDIKIETLSDLSHLQPFSEVSVLQRRYMPKSGRVQFFSGVSDMINDPWNTTTGINLRAAYGLTETWGIEVSDSFLGSSPSQSATSLFSQNNLNAQQFGTATGYLGAYIMWTPIYGKLSFSTKKIVPFDMYFSVGGGSTSLTGPGVPASASGVSMAMGQIFAITRSVGFRWDLTWNTYSIPTGGMNNILLTLGANWYFPEASYR